MVKKKWKKSFLFNEHKLSFYYFFCSMFDEKLRVPSSL